MIVLWLTFVLVITSGYSACLLSFLTVPHQKAPIKNFHQLSRAVQSGTHECHLLEGTNLASFLLRLEEDYLRELGKAIVKNEWYYTGEDLASGGHISDRVAEIMAQMDFDLFYGDPHFKANLVISDDYLAQFPVAIAVKKKILL
ncbi:PBPe domain-containing protein [Caerostris extrusa]|uniref:PBPe domain-containing protein n=1 Tax=Caerostris extrusa TaxID=172846 RepID=A0AAV4M6S4_CAEEX|nr:PBPe domain-containing protein [Caerostris extrusa]